MGSSHRASEIIDRARADGTAAATFGQAFARLRGIAEPPARQIAPLVAGSAVMRAPQQ